MTKLFLAVCMLWVVQPTTHSYQAQIEQWRARRLAALTSDNGWLTVTGLFWLKEGSNTVGAGKGNDIVLAKGSAPERVGTFGFHNGKTTFQAAAGAGATVDGKPVTSAALKPDTSGSPDIVRVRDLTLYVIRRGDRVGIRLKDRNSEFRKKFTGLKYFPADERYRVTAKFVPYDPPKMIPVTNILGQTDEEASPGYAEFTLNGHKCRLDPVVEENELFFIFQDLTSGKETYPPGRFLYTSMPKDGEVILDFNKAFNPPCAFTPYATCPLPPAENHLPIRIAAGELRYGH
jgi:uncharacterized protein (DUF1684 family)